jgi:hypothetical protein
VSDDKATLSLNWYLQTHKVGGDLGQKKLGETKKINRKPKSFSFYLAAPLSQPTKGRRSPSAPPPPSRSMAFSLPHSIQPLHVLSWPPSPSCGWLPKPELHTSLSCPALPTGCLPIIGPSAISAPPISIEATMGVVQTKSSPYSPFSLFLPLHHPPPSSPIPPPPIPFTVSHNSAVLIRDLTSHDPLPLCN